MGLPLSALPARSESFVLVDRSYRHSGWSRLYSTWDFATRIPTNRDAPKDWEQPVDFKNGTYQFRVEVLKMGELGENAQISFVGSTPAAIPRSNTQRATPCCLPNRAFMRHPIGFRNWPFTGGQRPAHDRMGLAQCIRHRLDLHHPQSPGQPSHRRISFQPPCNGHDLLRRRGRAAGTYGTHRRGRRLPSHRSTLAG